MGQKRHRGRVDIAHRTQEIAPREDSPCVALAQQGEKPAHLLRPQQPLHRQRDQIALVDHDVGAVFPRRGIEAGEGHLLAFVFERHGEKQEPIRGHGGRCHSPLQDAHEEGHPRRQPDTQPMRRRHFADAAHTPRGEPFHQVVHGRRAVAGGASQERDAIARDAGGERNAVGPGVFDLREESAEPPFQLRPARPLGETRRGESRVRPAVERRATLGRCPSATRRRSGATERAPPSS